MAQEKLVILGAGESGQGAALLGKVKGYEVFVSDAKPLTEKARTLFEQYQIE